MWGHKIMPRQLWHVFYWDTQEVQDFSILVGYGVLYVFGQPRGIEFQVFCIGFPYFNLESFSYVKFHFSLECLVIND